MHHKRVLKCPDDTLILPGDFPLSAVGESSQRMLNPNFLEKPKSGGSADTFNFNVHCCLIERNLGDDGALLNL